MKTTKQKLEQIKIDFYNAIEETGRRIIIGDLTDNNNVMEVRINNILVELTNLIDEVSENKRFYIKREYPRFDYSIIDRYTGHSIIDSRRNGVDMDLESYCAILNRGSSK